MSWITITEEQVAGRMTASEFNAYTNKYLRPGQASPLPEIITSITKKVRGYVAGNSDNVMQAGDTIPDELLDSALDLCRHKLSLRLSLPKEFTDTIKEAKDDAIKELRLASSGDFFVASAAAGSEAADQPQGSIEWSVGSGHEPTSIEMDGLI